MSANADTITKGQNIIDNIKVNVTAPASGKTPTATASVESENLTVISVSWSPADTTFRDGRPYTATINNENVEIISKSGKELTIAYTFCPGGVNKAEFTGRNQCSK